MGVFSWNCAHCQHSILAQSDPGINDWMEHAVVLTTYGIYEGKYDGYGGLEGGYAEEDGEYTEELHHGRGIMVHEACWEVAGKPEFSYYSERGMSSPPARDQGYFFDEEHDMIDPRITDLGERERLLDEGRRVRARARYDAKARDVGEAMAKAARLPPDDRWQVRFSIWEPKGLQTDFLIVNSILGFGVVEKGLTSKEAAVARARELYLQWIESEEFTTLHLHVRVLYDISQRAYLENLKEKGRYHTAAANVLGDSIRRDGRDWAGTRTVYSVQDTVTCLTVVTMDGPNEALGRKTFLPQEGYEGNTSPEWEARAQEVHAATRESARLAVAEAARLEGEWVAAGYPLPGPNQGDE
jgi:hypothetical protein